ncbi:MAG TPA: 16S rRNA (uracil(1498)-N(3))-methyltransferase [Clostridiaceae bacterium]|nr:16S rRNA (uracil(1498)-N(3))-methyltransferase [Clostridiaceae bacterium]
MPRFFIESVVPPSAITLTLDGDDTHHICQVLRLKVGDEIDVSDDHHTLHRCRIERLPDRGERLFVRILDRRPSDGEPPYRITLYQGLPKGDKMSTIIRMAVELGVTRVVPVIARRSVAKPDEKKMANRLQRWRRVAEAAAKQCGRGRIPDIQDFRTVREAIDELTDQVDGLIFVPYEGEDSVSLKALLQGEDLPRHIAFFIGPEGGFAGSEIADLQAAGWRTVTLGPRILRTETAAANVLSMLSYHFELA